MYLFQLTYRRSLTQRTYAHSISLPRVPLVLLAALASCSSPSRRLLSLDVQPSNTEALVGKTTPFRATGTFDKEPLTETNVNVQWNTSDANVATIDSTGMATCVAVGSVNVIASADGKGGTIQNSGALNCVSSLPPITGHCVVSNGVNTGDCIGELTGICHNAYDPVHCPPGGTPVNPQSESCHPGTFTTDAASSCVP
jgi:Bacterial Ig-like domain (group 2)